MSQNPVNPYLRTKILTASPEELRLMLYEGAIKFCRQAKPALEKQDYETSYICLTKAQKIALELSTSLNHNVAPELCSKLNALYTYIFRRLIEANTEHDPSALDECIGLLEYEKRTWEMLMDKNAKEGKDSGNGQSGNVTGAQQTAISMMTFNG
jgi:flagellar protein FliS